jgi:hypothetical protein
MTTRPSTLYDVRPAYVAWCFDRAVETFGKAMEDAMRAAAEGAKNDKSAKAAAERVGSRWLASAETGEAAIRGRFRDPMAR